MKRLAIMQGVSGSGKSTKAREISEMSDHAGKIFSTDNFFMKDGEYTFNPALLGKAHQWNQGEALEALAEGYPLVIIDNTNTQAWEAKPYVQAGLDAGYDIEFCRPDTEWADDAQVCFEKNTHGVPLASIRAMINRMEELTIEKCLASEPPKRKKRK